MSRLDTDAVYWFTSSRKAIYIQRAPVVIINCIEHSLLAGLDAFCQYRIGRLDIDGTISPVWDFELKPMQPLEQLAWLNRAEEVMEEGRTTSVCFGPNQA